MKFKKLEMKVSEEDIRAIAKTSLSLILARFTRKYQENAASLDKAFAQSDSYEILTELDKLIDSLKESIKELNQHADVVGSIPAIRKQEDKTEEQEEKK